MKKMCPLFRKFKFFAGVVSIILLISVQNTFGEVWTDPVTDIDENSATLHGSCDFWAVSRGFYIEGDIKYCDGEGEGPFSFEVTDLSPNTYYEYYAFARELGPTARGEYVEFRTTPEPCMFGFLGLVFLFFRRK